MPVSKEMPVSVCSWSDGERVHGALTAMKNLKSGNASDFWMIVDSAREL
jgi:hypothetical protein